MLNPTSQHNSSLFLLGNRSPGRLPLNSWRQCRLCLWTLEFQASPAAASSSGGSSSQPYARVRTRQLTLSHQTLRHTCYILSRIFSLLCTPVDLGDHWSLLSRLGREDFSLCSQQCSAKKALLNKSLGCSYGKNGGGWWAKGFRKGFGHFLASSLMCTAPLFRIRQYLLFIV